MKTLMLMMLMMMNGKYRFKIDRQKINMKNKKKKINGIMINHNLGYFNF